MRHRLARCIRAPLAVASAAVLLAVVAPPVAAAITGVTGQQCVDGGGVIIGDDPIPPGFCVGGKYDGQVIDD
ncbi:hypothetical protein [Actinomadura fibrosa]|uniref:Secreted protein n=1 Tax=Actinomadura fibrosa TaxID=111802 RepID=A0ABW2Y1R9_9ACTN|nr:hypothetical protein [Actinomadura fibrosa]